MSNIIDALHLQDAATESRQYTDKEISHLAALVLNAFNEMQSRSVAISISATAWEKRGTVSKYTCRVPIEGLRETDRVDICVDENSALIASACCLHSVCDSVDGAVLVYADSAASGTIKATALIKRMGG